MTDTTEPQTNAQPPYSLWQLTLYFLKLGTLGFGGPVALVGYMKRDLVDDLHWISEEDFDILPSRDAS